MSVFAAFILLVTVYAIWSARRQHLIEMAWINDTKRRIDESLAEFDTDQPDNTAPARTEEQETER